MWNKQFVLKNVLIDFAGSKSISGPPGRAAKVVLVYFIGGCTYSEIAALRFLGKQTGWYI